MGGTYLKKDCIKLLFLLLLPIGLWTYPGRSHDAKHDLIHNVPSMLSNHMILHIVFSRCFMPALCAH